MPKLKQPVSLRDASMEYIVTFFADYFHKHSTEGSLLKIREGVAVVRDTAMQIPCGLEAEFCYRLIKEFLWSCGKTIKRPDAHIRAMAEIIMDRRIIGLKCSYRLVDFVRPEDTHRFFGLKALNLGGYHRAPVHILENFRIQDITSLIYAVNCTDSNLEKIGRNCKKLMNLDVQNSDNVTDVGLRALRECRNLQFICLFRCSVSESGILEMLLTNTRVRRLTLDDEFNNTLKWFTIADSSVYPAIEDFALKLGSWPKGSLRSLIDRFPNLKSLRLYGNGATEDLHELKRLSRLSELRLEQDSSLLWNEKFLDLLFGFVGANLLSLTLFETEARQSVVDIIFHWCHNLEILDFSYAPGIVKKLRIPTHPNLKKMHCIYSQMRHPKIEFGIMSKLTELYLSGFRMSLEQIKTIVFDHINFPELKKMTFPKWTKRYDVEQIRQVARAKNLDIELVKARDPLAGFLPDYED